MGSPQSNKAKKGDPQSQKQGDMDLRDGRKQLSEEQKRAQAQKNKNGNEPKSGEKSPTDPAKRVPNARPEEGKAGSDPARGDNVPAWVTALPPEIREAFAGGQAEKIPSRYRHLISKYNLWLQKNAGKDR